MSKQISMDNKAEIDLSQMVGDLFDRKWIILAVAVCSAIVGFAFASMNPQEYASTAILRIEKESTLVQNNTLQSLLSGGGAEAPSEIATIKSRAILGEVLGNPFAKVSIYPISSLGSSMKIPARLDMPLQGASPFPYLMLDSVDIQDKWLGSDSPIFITYEGGDIISVDLPDGNKLSGKIGETIENKDGTFRLLASHVVAADGQRFRMSGRSKVAALERFSTDLQVSEIKATNLIRLTYRNTSPAAATSVLGDIVFAYKNYNEAYMVSQAQRRLEYAESQLPKAIQDIDDAEHALIKYQTNNRAMGVQFQTEALLKRMAEVEEALRQGQIPKEQEKLEETKRQILSELRGLPDAQQRTQALVRDIEIAQEIYLELMRMVQTLRVARAGTQSTVSILDVPFSNEKRLNSPKRQAVVISAASTVLYILWIIVWVTMRSTGEIAAKRRPAKPARSA